VQSVALRLVCEREDEIKAFVPVPYWNVAAEFETGRGEKYKGTLLRIDGAYRKIASADELERVKGFLKPGIKLNVTSFRVTTPERIPPPPFITSSLQQEASRRYNFPPKRTMQFAQSLYEGVSLPEGRIGLITYMRTDSIRVNAGAIEVLREYIDNKYGSEYMTREPRAFKDRKGSQAGHEAIRPTRVKLEPDSIKGALTPEQYKIYKLIYERYVASQMSAARYSLKEALMEYMGLEFKAEETKPVFLGYQLLTGETTERGYVPDLKVGDAVTLLDAVFEEKATEPLPRYAEASLIKKLEENGIGRPSTYAYIIQTLYERRYVVKENGKIVPSELGTEVFKIIIPRFSNIFEVSFTARMEEELDKIENGKKVWQEVVREFYEPFEVSLHNAEADKEKLIERAQQRVEKNCPKCQRPLIIRWGRYGKFLACSGFPECKYSENLEAETTQKSCPKCGSNLVIKHGKFGEFLACSGYPDCRYTENLTHPVPCPVCGGEVIIFTSRRGKAYKCKACGFVSYYPPVEEKCPGCGKGMVQKKGKAFCPACDRQKKDADNG
jgi:DNA topoisomerase-1